jgi:hypothetical protein
MANDRSHYYLDGCRSPGDAYPPLRRGMVASREGAESVPGGWLPSALGALGFCSWSSEWNPEPPPSEERPRSGPDFLVE